jgi:hypothetical protein
MAPDATTCAGYHAADELAFAPGYGDPKNVKLPWCSGLLLQNTWVGPSLSLDRMKRTPEEIANTIEDFVNGTGKQWDWDGFISIRLDDADLEAIRQRCISIRDEFPPSAPRDYCSDAGLKIMRQIVQDLRARSSGTRAT